MEKEIQPAECKLKTVVITGPESTGKSTLAEELALHFETEFIPEYARDYIEQLNRPYNYNDVEVIARQQIEELEKYRNKTHNILFVDTYLIITKVWFDIVYNKCPIWITNNIKNSNIDLYLVCDTSLPWIPDNVRENGGERREMLLKRYISELEKFNLPFRIITGKGKERTNSAIDIINAYFKL